jgi:hypothetical protein
MNRLNQTKLATVYNLTLLAFFRDSVLSIAWMLSGSQDKYVKLIFQHLHLVYPVMKKCANNSGNVQNTIGLRNFVAETITTLSQKK